ncbi:hypothetical protein [Streptomyces sp. NRRL S-87]|uniref:hypothetical protein n=1 Tax=Streptomyces sp. NRRL S-87 TaxID=1463920 RepID=UPI000690416F|nr:hypothetical protein [Streptomyces sp. NRRL S-87]
MDMDLVQVAEEALAELKEGLEAAGITLPSLRLDPVSSAGNYPRPLIDLGRCNPATARELAAALRGDRLRGRVRELNRTSQQTFR